MTDNPILPGEITRHRQAMENQAENVRDSLPGYSDKDLAALYVKYTTNREQHETDYETNRKPVEDWKNSLIGALGERTFYKGVEKAVEKRFDTEGKAQSFVQAVIEHASENDTELDYVLGQLITDAARFNQPILLEAALKEARTMAEEVDGKIKYPDTVDGKMHNGIVVAAQRSHFNVVQMLVDAQGGLDAYLEKSTSTNSRNVDVLTFDADNAEITVEELKAGLQANAARNTVLQHAANGRYLEMADVIDALPNVGYYSSLASFNAANHIEKDFKENVPNSNGVPIEITYGALENGYGYAKAAKEFSAAGIHFTPEQVEQMEAVLPEENQGMWDQLIDGSEFGNIKTAMNGADLLKNHWRPINAEGNLTPGTTPQQIVDAVVERFTP